MHITLRILTAAVLTGTLYGLGRFSGRITERCAWLNHKGVK